MVQVSIMEDHQGRVEEKESTGGWQTRPLRQLRKGGGKKGGHRTFRGGRFSILY